MVVRVEPADWKAFPLPLRVEWIDGETWLLLSPFAYAPKDGAPFYVQQGFVTDFASIPTRTLRGWLPPTGPYGPAAVIHDYLYQFPVELSRGDCDRIFNEAMKDLKVPGFTRRLVYAGVRAGGWATWRKYRKVE
jgi:hypothetical protein